MSTAGTTVPNATVRAGSTAGLAFIAAGATAIGIGVGYLIALDPEWLHIGFGQPRPIHLLAVVVGFPAALAILRWPEAAVLGLMAVIYTNASEIGTRYHGAPSLLQVFLPLLLVAALRRITIGRIPIAWAPPAVWALAYAAVFLLATENARNTALAGEAIFELGKQLTIVFVVSNLVRTRRTLRASGWVLIWVGLFLGTLTTYQVLTSSYGTELAGFGRVKLAQIYGEVRDPRITGPLSDPNFYAQILVTLVPIIAYHVWQAGNWLKRAVAGYALAVVVTALLFTYSRGGIVTLAVVACLIGMLHWRQALRVAPVLFLAGVVIIILLPDAVSRRLETLRQLLPGYELPIVRTDSSFRQRLLYMETAGEMLRQRPVLGFGPGQYTEHYEEYADRIGSSVSSYDHFEKRRYPHSLFLEIGAETGVLGLAAFAAVIVSTLAALRRAAKRFAARGENDLGEMMAALAIGMVGFLLTSVVLHGAYLRHFWLLVALAIAGSDLARTASPERYPRESSA